jgi:hypothetical protein
LLNLVLFDILRDALMLLFPPLAARRLLEACCDKTGVFVVAAGDVASATTPVADFRGTEAAGELKNTRT